ncbi:MAG: cbb3-type cytochrome c oxidase subunit II [Verrucomicrobia bacterium]|nr:cbb3-type cytochrome c oxidase subunit II [Verrucomicrobiota bacterium]MBI3871258.1 cbb3-type cytochrome c oxidase subunit II [Verrucomicrobiota bacterium]
MNQVPLVFLGLVAAVAGSFYGAIFLPHHAVGRAELEYVDDTGAYYPAPRNGLAQQGAEVYRAQGCVECHTQQVRPKTLGSDVARGWGRRRTIAQDYAQDNPVQLGSLRLGPDLTNVGKRQPSSLSNLRHLYNPRLVVKESYMPRYEYLFFKRKLEANEKPSLNALPADTEAGYEVTPKPQALALVAYLQSLSADVPLFSAPLPVAVTNQVKAPSLTQKP